MDYEKAAREFLLTEENLPVALEIARIVENIKPELHRVFWRALHDNLTIKLGRSDWSDKWRVSYRPDIKHFKKDWFGCSLVPQYEAGDCTYYTVRLEQTTRSDGYRLFYGVQRSQRNPLPREDDLPQVISLKRGLEERGLRDNEVWWIGIKNLSDRAASHEFLLRMSNDKEAFVDEIAQLLWSLLTECGDLIEAANQALAEVKG